MANLFVFYQGKGNSGTLWYTVSGDSINWNQHPPVPNLGMSASPSAVRWQDGIEVFFQGANNDGQLWRTFSADGNSWGTTQTNVQVPGVGMSGSPSAVVYNGSLYVFYQGLNNSGGLWYTVSADSINWTQHPPVPNLGMKESPSAVLWQGGIQVFHQAGNGQLWRTFSSDGNNWGTTQTDAQVPGVGMSGSPSAVVYNGSLYVFYQGLNNSGGLWYAVSSDSINWTQHNPVPNLVMSGSPSAVLWQGGIEVFFQGANNDGQLWRTFSPDGNNWGTTQTNVQVMGVGMSGSPSCVVVVPTTSIDYSIWSLQEPSGSGTSPTTISPSQLVAGYSDAYFYIAADGGQAFMDTQTGITTSGSAHCRTELREVTWSGTQAAWAPSGTNTMDVTGQVTLLGGGSSGAVTVGQVFNSNDSIPLCELMYSSSVGGFVLLYEEAKGAGTTVDLQTPAALNTPYSFQLSLTNGVLTVSINGTQVYSHTPSSSILSKEFYFKCGNYDQTTSSGAVTTTPYTIVENYSIDVVHEA